jgi:hypothetical protein
MKQVKLMSQPVHSLQSFLAVIPMVAIFRVPLKPMES